MRALILWFRFSFETCLRIAALLALSSANGAYRKQFQNLLCCHREKARDLRNVAALINEKEIAKHEGEANVQVM